MHDLEEGGGVQGPRAGRGGRRLISSPPYARNRPRLSANESEGWDDCVSRCMKEQERLDGCSRDVGEEDDETALEVVQAAWGHTGKAGARVSWTAL